MVITRMRADSQMADDDGTVPNRTRHSVMRSPMSAEADFLSILSKCLLKQLDFDQKDVIV